MTKLNCAEIRFDPEKSAIENMFSLIHRFNGPHINVNTVDVGIPESQAEDEHGCDTNIYVVAKPTAFFEGEDTIYYARVELGEHYPYGTITEEEITAVSSREELVAYLDSKFNLIDGEFYSDIPEDPEEWVALLDFSLIARNQSYIYIGRKGIEIIWTAPRRITEEGALRVTDDGYVRVYD